MKKTTMTYKLHDIQLSCSRNHRHCLPIYDQIKVQSPKSPTDVLLSYLLQRSLAPLSHFRWTDIRCPDVQNYVYPLHRFYTITFRIQVLFFHPILCTLCYDEQGWIPYWRKTALLDGAGLLKSGSVPTLVLGKAMTSRMDWVLQRIDMRRSNPAHEMPNQ